MSEGEYDNLDAESVYAYDTIRALTKQRDALWAALRHTSQKNHYEFHETPHDWEGCPSPTCVADRQALAGQPEEVGETLRERVTRVEKSHGVRHPECLFCLTAPGGATIYAVRQAPSAEQGS